MISQALFARKVFSTLLTLQLAILLCLVVGIVLRLLCILPPWVLPLVVGVPVFNAGMETLADLTDEVTGCNLDETSMIRYLTNSIQGL